MPQFDAIHPAFVNVFEAVRAALHGEQFRQFSTFSDTAKEDFRRIAKRHSVSALLSLSVDDEELKDKYNSTLYKNLMHDDELQKFGAFCEEAGIWYCPMKGAALESLYPGYGTREMTDRDILFDESKREQVREYFTGAEFKVDAYGATNHDVYHKEPFFSFELHVALFRGEDVESFADYYQDAYPRLIKHQCCTAKSDGLNPTAGRDSDVCPCANGISMKCDMNASDFYVFNLAHIIKHYVEGGIQIKSLVDIYVMLSKLQGLDWTYVETEEDKLGTLELERELRSLVKKLFGGELGAASTLPELTDEEVKILRVVTFYGQFSTDLAILQRKIAKKSRARVLLEAAFPGPSYMKQKYPRAGKCYVIYPALWLIRIISMLVSPDRRKAAQNRTNDITNQSKLSEYDRLRLETIKNGKLL